MEEKRALFTLTVEEFKALSKKIAVDISNLIQPRAPKENESQDIIFINELTELTGYKESTVYSKVSRREIPVVSSGRPLTFSRSEILEWMKSGKPTVSEMLAESIIKKSKK